MTSATREGGRAQSGYVPLDPADFADTSVEIFEDPQDVVLGSRELYGIPFQFGEAERSVLHVEPGESVEISVGKTCRWIVFAHAVLEADLFEGAPIGETVGKYTIRLEDGSSISQDIRQRFEIGPTPRRWEGRALPLDWGQTPLLARNDAEHRLMSRVCGRFDEAGARLVDIEDPQSRVPYVLPYRFYLWGMPVPESSGVVTSIELEAKRVGILIGAVTLSLLSEPPFTRSVAREMIVQLHDGVITEETEVLVDRGTSSYLYRTAPLPDTSSGLPPGWGVPRPDTWATGYAKVSASESATVQVQQSGTPIIEFTWGDLLTHGTIKSDVATITLPHADRSWVHVKVVDETGAPVAARIRFQTPDGIPIAPYGHHAHINSDGGTWNLDIGGDVRLGAYSYAFIDGSCEVWLPFGAVQVEVARGFEVRPIRQLITIDNSTSHITLRTERVFDARSRGYLSGDTHVHFVSTQGAEREAQAEDVQVANLLLTQWGHLFTNTEDFTGHPHVSNNGRSVVVAGQENRTNMLGHINLLGLKRPIMPWCTGGSEEAELGGGLMTTLSRWADECHQQGGTVVLAHFPVPYGETAALLATGRLDAVETIAFDDYNFSEYYRYLNAGYQIPLAAGTDKMTAEVAIGMMRTYAGVPSGQLDYWQWCAGIRQGNTMVSSGPLLWLKVDGHQPGTVLRNRSSVEVTVELESLFPVDMIELVVNGQIAHRQPVTQGAETYQFSTSLSIGGSDWIAARCFGVGEGVMRHADTWSRPVFSHTSPIYISQNDSYLRHDIDLTHMMLATVDGARRYILECARLDWGGSVRHRHGESDHVAYLVQPLDEAERALRAKLHDANSERTIS